MTIDYRAAMPNDLSEIMALVRAAVADLCARGIPQWDDVYPNEAVLREDIAKGQLTVGQIGGRVAVLYALSEDCDPQYANGCWHYADQPFRVVHRLCVHPDFQHGGVGKATMRHIEEQVLAVGIRELRLDAFTQNPYSLRLYEGLGYTKVGHADWRKGRFWLMEKHL